MEIKIKDMSPSGVRAGDVIQAIKGVIRESRFTVQQILEKGPFHVSLHGIRLKESKMYCGQHPELCQRLIAPPKRNRRCLEGADWVEFDDIINNILDDLQADADLYSKSPEFGPKQVMYCRLGLLRRYRFLSYYPPGRPFGNPLWDSVSHPDCFQNNIDPDRYSAPYELFVTGRTKHVLWSEFPEGTPGIHAGREYYSDGESLDLKYEDRPKV